MKKFLLALFLMVGIFGLVACGDCGTSCNATDEEPAKEEVKENVEEEAPNTENEVGDPEEAATVPHMLGCPCCTSA